MDVNREALRSSSRVRKKKISQAFSYLCLFLAIIFALINYLFHLDNLYITKVYIQGNKQVENSRIFNIVKESLDGKYLGLYPKNNVFIYPKKMIIESLLHNIPTIASVDVSNNHASLFLNIQERVPKYLWCDDLTKSMLSRACYYLDVDGFAFDKAPSFSNHVYLEFYGGNKRGGYLGQSILSPAVIHAVVDIKDYVERLIADRRYPLGDLYGVNVYPDGGDYDILFASGAKEWKVIFNLDPNLLESNKQSIEKKFRAIMISSFFLKELGAAGNRLEYIDLRFGKKVFYKFNHGV